MDTPRNFKPASIGKIIQLDYDFILAQTGECSVCLTRQQIQMILGVLDYYGWTTRWASSIGTAIDQRTIFDLQGDLARRLMANCQDVEPQQTRYSDSGIFQVFNPITGLWEDHPELDPRLNAPDVPLLPAAPSDSTRCAAADNVRDQFTLWRDQIVAALDTLAGISGIVSFLVGLLGVLLFASVVGTAWAVMLWGLAAILYDLGSAGVSAQITESVLEQFKCLVYCHTEDDGTITENGWQELLIDIAATFDGFPETFFYQITASLGYKGMTAVAALGASSASDCGDCDCDGDLWCYDFDFTAVDGGFVASPWGAWVSGTGWTPTVGGTGTAINIIRDGITAAHWTRLDIWIAPGFDEGSFGVYLVDGTGTHPVVLTHDIGTDHWWADIDIDPTEIIINPSSGSSSFAYAVYELTLRGTGVNPFGADNC